MIQKFKQLRLHDPSIAQICFAGQFQNAIASIGDDCFLRLFDTHNLQLFQQRNLCKSYLTSIITDSTLFNVGTGYGEILTIDPKTLNILGTYKLHNDCITSILQQDNTLVTASFDGLVKFTDKRNMKTFKKVDVNTPITQIVSFRDKYLTAGVRSFQIQNDNVKQFGRYNAFLTAYNKLYGTNDENGFTCITEKQKRYVPCQIMVAYKSGVLGISWQAVSFFGSNKQDSISCLSVQQKRFEPGFSIVSVLVKQDLIYGGGQCGNLYVFELDMSHSWLRE